MFARIRKNARTNICSVLACHNIRIGDKVEQIIVKIFCHSSDVSVLQAKFEEAKEWIQTRLPIKKQAIMSNKQVSLFNLREKKRINVGIEDVFGNLYEHLGFNNLLSKRDQEVLKKVLFARILEPSSKRQGAFG